MTVLVGVAGQPLVRVGVNPVLGQPQLGSVLNGVDALVVGHCGQQCLAQRGLAAAHRGCDHHIGPRPTRDGLDEHAAQFVRHDAEVVEAHAARHVRAQHDVGRAGHEGFSVEAPAIADPHIEPGVELVEALGSIAGIARQEPHRLDQLGVCSERRRPPLYAAVCILHQHRLAAAYLEFLDVGLIEQLRERVGGSAGGSAPPNLTVRTVEPLRGAGRCRQRTPQPVQLPVGTARVHPLDAHDPLRSERRGQLTGGIAAPTAGGRQPHRGARHAARRRSAPRLRGVSAADGA